MKTFTLILVCLRAFIPMSAQAECWSRIWSEASTQTIGKVDFVNDQLGWAVRSSGLGSGTVLRTTDGGVTWTVQFTCNYGLANLDFVDANHGWLVGYYSIFRTSDGGYTWIRTNADHSTMTGVFFADVNNGWVVGDDLNGGNSPIWHTTDGSVSWMPQSSGTIYGLQEVAFADLNNGAAVGLVGTILGTTNGGSTWSPRTSGTTYSLNGVCFSQGFGFAVGVHGTILGTFDSGNSWSAALTVGTTASFYDVSVAGANAWAVGDSSLILGTTSAGFVWTRDFFSLSLYPLLLGVASAGDEAWAVGYNSSGQNLVFHNRCDAPQDVTIHYLSGHPPFEMHFIYLNWNPVTTPGAVSYNVYCDSVVTGLFLNLVGSTSDTSFGIFGGGLDRQFYIVKTETP